MDKAEIINLKDYQACSCKKPMASLITILKSNQVTFRRAICSKCNKKINK